LVERLLYTQDVGGSSPSPPTNFIEVGCARVLELWDAPVAENEPLKYGWLCNYILLNPSTLNLKTHVHVRAGGGRP
jgi:hypothetical protein